jgi:hypothetical protein
MSTKKERTDTRYLEVQGQPWEFKIGRRFVAIYGPENQRFYVEHEDIDGGGKGRKYDSRLDGYKDTYSIGPAAIRNYIETKILGVEIPSHRKCIRCKEIKADVYMRPNPYAAEIEDNYTKHNYCNDCVSELAEDI